MRLLGLLRAVLSWAVGGYLLAVAAFGPVLALYLLTGGRTGLVVGALAGPAALLVLTPYAASRVLAPLTDAGADPDIGATRLAGAAFEQRGLARPTAWVAPGLGEGAVVVRGFRRSSVVLPASTGPGSLDSPVALAARRDLDGTSFVLPVHVATAAALSHWVGMVRFFVAPWADRQMDGYYRARMFFLPLFSPLPALGVVLAWPAVLLSTLLVGPGAARDLVAAAGTADGPLERTRRVYDSGRQLARRSRSLASQGDDVTESTGRAPVLDGRSVGLLRLPTTVAATQSGFSVPAFAAAGIILGVLLWQPAALVLGTPDPKAPLITTLFFLVPLLVVTVTLTRMVTAHAPIREHEREVRAQALGESTRTPVEPADPRQAGPRGSGRPPVHQVLGMWPYWLLVLVVSAGLGWVLALVVGLVGRFSGHTDQFRQVAFSVAFPIVLVVAVLWTLDSVFRRGDPLRLVRHSRASRGLSADEPPGR